MSDLKNNIEKTDFLGNSASKSQTVVYLGIAMFLLNLSFIMMYNIFPAYLMTLGKSQTSIGFIEGLFEMISQLMKFSSGFISDLLMRRKLLVFIGMGLMVAGRSMVGFSSSFFYVILGRSIDRVGNGVHSVPRDSLIAAAADKSKRAQSFGLTRSLGQLGPIVGSFLAIFLMKKLGFSFKDILIFMTVPAFIALFIVTFKTKEIPFEKKIVEKRFHWHELKKTGVNFMLLMIVNFLFSLGRCDETMMFLFAIKKFNFSYENIPYISALYNLLYVCFSYPIGRLSDRIGRFIVLAFGLSSFILSGIIFYNATTIFEFFLGVVFWGMQMGIIMNAFTSLIVDAVHPGLRGTAFGLYYLINALCLFSANFIGGYIADTFGNSYVYLYSSIWGSLSLIALMIIMKYRDLTHQY